MQHAPTPRLRRGGAPSYKITVIYLPARLGIRHGAKLRCASALDKGALNHEISRISDVRRWLESARHQQRG